MLKDVLKNHQVILASSSPRRQKFFEKMELDFEIRLKEVEEIYPETLQHLEIPIFLAELKAKAFSNTLQSNDILITSDTIVWHQNRALGKPKTLEQAKEMIQSMAGTTHEVLTAVCFTTPTKSIVVDDITKVTFAELTKDEINHYVDTYKPLDKAGAYGIQEWIGLIGITTITGNYNNVVGLPTHLVYKTLKELVKP